MKRYVLVILLLFAFCTCLTLRNSTSTMTDNGSIGESDAIETSDGNVIVVTGRLSAPSRLYIELYNAAENSFTQSYTTHIHYVIPSNCVEIGKLGNDRYLVLHGLNFNNGMFMFSYYSVVTYSPATASFTISGNVSFTFDTFGTGDLRPFYIGDDSVGMSCIYNNASEFYLGMMVANVTEDVLTVTNSVTLLPLGSFVHSSHTPFVIFHNDIVYVSLTDGNTSFHEVTLEAFFFPNGSHIGSVSSGYASPADGRDFPLHYTTGNTISLAITLASESFIQVYDVSSPLPVFVEQVAIGPSVLDINADCSIENFLPDLQLTAVGCLRNYRMYLSLYNGPPRSANLIQSIVEYTMLGKAEIDVEASSLGNLVSIISNETGMVFAYLYDNDAINYTTTATSTAVSTSTVSTSTTGISTTGTSTTGSLTGGASIASGGSTETPSDLTPSNNLGSIIGSVAGVSALTFLLLLFCCCVLFLCTIVIITFILIAVLLVVSAGGTTAMGGGGGAVGLYMMKDKKGPSPESLQFQVVDPSTLVYEEIIGEGAFGVVYRGFWRSVVVAIKEIKDTGKGFEEFEREATLMSQVGNHPNVVNFIGACSDLANKKFILITPYMEKGSLYSRIVQPKTPLSDKRLFQIICDVLKGVFHLHEQKVIHRDIATRNVLVDKDGTCKLTDFGVSRMLENHVEKTTKSDVGPVRWMAPESISKKQYGPASDAWMVGVLIWELVVKETPYAGLRGVDVARGVPDRSLKLEVPDDAPPLAKELMQGFMQFKPKKRTTISDALVKVAAHLGTSSVGFMKSIGSSKSARISAKMTDSVDHGSTTKSIITPSCVDGYEQDDGAPAEIVNLDDSECNGPTPSNYMSSKSTTEIGIHASRAETDYDCGESDYDCAKVDESQLESKCSSESSDEIINLDDS